MHLWMHADSHAPGCTDTHFLPEAQLHVGPSMFSCYQWKFQFLFYFFPPSLLFFILNFSPKPSAKSAAKYGQTGVVNSEWPPPASQRSWPLRPGLRQGFRHRLTRPRRRVACVQRHTTSGWDLMISDIFTPFEPLVLLFLLPHFMAFLIVFVTDRGLFYYFPPNDIKDPGN